MWSCVEEDSEGDGGGGNGNRSSCRCGQGGEKCWEEDYRGKIVERKTEEETWDGLVKENVGMIQREKDFGDETKMNLKRKTTGLLLRNKSRERIRDRKILK